MGSAHTFQVRVDRTSITCTCYPETLGRFLQESFSPLEAPASSGEAEVRLVVRETKSGEEEEFCFHPQTCIPLEGFFTLPTPHPTLFFQLYRKGDLLIYRRGLPLPSVLGIWEPGAGRGTVLVPPDPDPEDTRVALLALMRVALKESGLFPLHAAGLAKGKQVVLVPAPGGTGKTAIALALLERSFLLLSDDTVLLKEEGDELTVLGFPEKPRISSGHVKLLPGLRVPRPLPKEETKVHIAPAALAFGQLERGNPALMVFLIRASEDLLLPLDPRQALLCLEKELTFPKADAGAYRRYFRILLRLSSRVPAWIAGSPNPRDLARRIETLLEGWPARNQPGSPAQTLPVSQGEG